MKKITIYSTNSIFGNILKTEGTLVEIGRENYAQYHQAPFVKFIPKRKRTAYIARATYKPYLLVLEGHGHPDPDDMMMPADTFGTGVTTSKSRYRSFDERYETDFDAKIQDYLKTQNVLLDIRHSAGKEVMS